jgi:hypothetical protein
MEPPMLSAGATFLLMAQKLADRRKVPPSSLRSTSG